MIYKNLLKTALVFISIGVSIIGIYLYIKIPLNFQHGPYFLNLNDKKISLIIADTGESRAKGLSDRESLSGDTAMLFVFNKIGKYGFWMKNMKFPIDIIWLDMFENIIYIEKNVKPETYPTVFIPPQNSLYVVEANAGFAEKNDLMVGNILDISKK